MANEEVTSEPQINSTASAPNSRQPRTRGRGGRIFGALLLLGTGAVIGAAGTVAAGATAFGGWHGHHARTPQAIGQRVKHKASWVLKALDANEQQQAEVNDVLTEVVETTLPFVVEHRIRRKAWISALTAPEIDQNAIESMRAEELALLDAASDQLVPKLIRIAQILTPEQRAQIARHIVERHRRH